MGQPITVVRKASSNPEVLRFEINRSLTGMGHERYCSPPDPLLARPVDELARRILGHGGVHCVHVNSNVITVDLAKGSTGDGLEDVIRSLFLFYPPSSRPEDSVEQGAADPEPAPDADPDTAPAPEPD